MQKIGDIPNTRADNNGEFTDGNVAAGVPPTILPAEWFNTLQRELIKVVQEGGLTLDPNDDTQILAALNKLFLQSGNNLSEIKAAGPTAVAAALANLGALSITGTAAAATKLATARKIGGVVFDGTADIALPFINSMDTDIQLAGALGVKSLSVTGDLHGGRLISKGAVYANENGGGGTAMLGTDGNITGSIWGSNLYNYMNTIDLIGSPIPWPQATLPTGYLKCNGAAFSKTQYPKLALAYPSGVLPDMRGDVIRAWDDGRGVDAGRALLSEQGDAIRNITGTFSVHGAKELSTSYPSAASGAFAISGVAGRNNVAAGGDTTIPQFNFSAANVVPTAAENRMRNIAFNYIVRAL
ncbi:phage tail protein [Yersinia frederiksenii]|uniref:phage tail protein n=1 Tax=Yersinia frederiksenii TaxID=29484 RepID=UPI003EB91B58